MIRICFSLVVCCLFVCCTVAQTQAQTTSPSTNLAVQVVPALVGFYVGTNGSDSNAGTLDAPLASLGKCQTAMQNSTVKTCYIRVGTYTPAATGTGCYGAVALILGNSDVGETWSYYPPDGYTPQ
jgi:hypothetical protein